MAMDPMRKRRFLQKRSHTLAAVPSELIPEVENEQESSEQAKLIKVGQSPTRSYGESKSDPEDEEHVRDEETKPLHPSPRSPKPGNVKQKKTRFQNAGLTLKVDQATTLREANESSSTNSNLGASGGSAKSANGSQTPNLSRPKRSSLESGESKSASAGAKSPTTPSVLFSRVKERIREKVFQSSEWPNAAAMMQEKRQKANDALSASLNSRKNLNLEQIQLHELSKRKGGRTKGDAKYEMGVQEKRSGKGDSVRTAFIRRRSISEDTYDRPPQPQLKSGAVCSNEDLEGLNQDPHMVSPGAPLVRRGSPRPMKNHMRCVSLDSGRLTRLGSASMRNTSLESSTSTMCSARTNDSADNISVASKGSKGSGGVHRQEFDLASGFHNLYPEIVLDSKTKTILEEGDDDQAVGGVVPEVVFDESGQTWDVYGAEFDPEILGSAIQKHLEKLMNPESDRRMSQVACQQELQKLEENGTNGSDKAGREQSFWLRWLCLFTGRSEVAS